MLESDDSVVSSPGEEGLTADVVSPGFVGLVGFVPSAVVSPGFVELVGFVPSAVVSPGFVGFVPSPVVSPGFVGFVPSAVVSPGFVGFTGSPFSSVSSIDMPSDVDSRSSISSDSFVDFFVSSVSFVSFGTYP